MENIPESIRGRMPSDLLEYVLEQKSVTDLPISEQDPADVACELFNIGPFALKAYYPASPGNDTVVFVHLPGGESQALIWLLQL